jgi:cytochrome c553
MNKTNFSHHFLTMTSSVRCIFATVAVVTTLALSACANLDRSRDWANGNVSGTVLAQQVCSTCHGINGQSNNTMFPKLAGQQKNYLLGQLEALKSRDRNSEHTRQFMWGPSRYLTPKQMDEIATYFSGQPAMKGVLPLQEVPEIGKVIFHQGAPEKGVRACASCHGSKGEGDDVVPRVAGQHQYYLVSRARIAMTKIVSMLSDQEIAAVSAYLESIGEGGATPADLPTPNTKVVGAAGPDGLPVPKAFDPEGNPDNCHYSVWTYGWYCGNFWDALGYHLKNQ